jgi:hypothetical protein
MSLGMCMTSIIPTTMRRPIKPGILISAGNDTRGFRTCITATSMSPRQCAKRPRAPEG